MCDFFPTSKIPCIRAGYESNIPDIFEGHRMAFSLSRLYKIRTVFHLSAFDKTDEELLKWAQGVRGGGLRTRHD